MIAELLLLIFMVPVFIGGSFLVLHSLLVLARRRTSTGRSESRQVIRRFVRSSTIGG